MPDARTRTPKPVPERRDIRLAPLTSTDGFILSRVDGVLDEIEIVGSTGLPDHVVLTSLRKLESLGLITFDGLDSHAPTAPDVGRARMGASLPPSGIPQSVVASVSAQSSVRPQPVGQTYTDSSLMTPAETAILSEDVDLDLETRRQVILTYRSLERADHYAMLKVERTADRKALKRAYYDLASKFHPDRYFRKSLGSYKLRMEAIFGRITLAHDTLTDKQRRAEYDAYVEEQRRSRSIEELLAEALTEAKRTEERIEQEAHEPERAGTGSVSELGPPEPQAAAPASATSAPLSPSSSMAGASRRDALARRLLGGRALPQSNPPSASHPTSKPPVGSPSDAMLALRRRYEDRVTAAKKAQALHYATNAQAALAAGDPVAAANAFRVALTLSPTDPDLVRMAQEAQQKADAILSETYARQAGYEEKNGQWAEAARSWGRVLKARPNDAGAHERAASALIKADGDLHEAARVARVACALEPANPAFHVTLANVYLAAGLTLNARRELETATQLAPHDDTIQAVLQRVGKS